MPAIFERGSTSSESLNPRDSINVLRATHLAYTSGHPSCPANVASPIRNAHRARLAFFHNVPSWAGKPVMKVPDAFNARMAAERKAAKAGVGQL